MEEAMRVEGLHVVAFPFPLQGHISPMLQLSYLLASRGITVTFVHLQSNFSRLHFSDAVPAAGQLPPLNIRHISLDGSLADNPCSSASSTRDHALETERLQPAFYNLLSRLHASSKVSCVIADALLSWALSVAAHMGILGASLFTGALSSFMSYCNIPLLASLGVFPIKDMDVAAQRTLIRCIPGLPQIYSFTDLPSFFHAPSWPDDVLDFISRQMDFLTRNATWVLSNSVSLEPDRELEEEMRKSLPIISVGPLLSHGIFHNEGNKSNSGHVRDEYIEKANIDSTLLDTHSVCHTARPHAITHPRASLWAEDTSCLEWLNGRPPSSVIYISFGSLVAIPPLQIDEFFAGLEASQHPFLWALRPDSIVQECNSEDSNQTSATSIKVNGLARRTGLGLVVSWAPQVDVLAHKAIGGFVTHCGWNSMMESIALGKPMLGFPRFAEQRMNCKLMEHWQVGRELKVGSKGLVERNEVETCVRSLMDVNASTSVRSACAKLQCNLHHAIFHSSEANLNRFVTELGEKTD